MSDDSLLDEDTLKDYFKYMREYTGIFDGSRIIKSLTHHKIIF